MEATLISTSRPSEVYSTPSARSVRSLLRRLTTATTDAPLAFTSSTVRLVSVVVPDCEMATTSVSDMSARNPNADSSVAGSALTSSAASAPDSAMSMLRPCARLSPATAAVPCPMASTDDTEPSRRPDRTSSGSVSGPIDRSRPAGVSMILPRSVLRNDDGASPISLSR